ncbi:F0F1 ATP synthase subunit delta [Pseudoxanthomonas winnipegensis]|uniref:ATP synthase subunit delta n=1 Tax=Pseudoxanthomonas winnipegensis TaxID=2480810 RepID=A0A4Q8LP66_9GAMM|nr:F0F1 ATP synthase subunit delta [Pseudoxanthomonas winnipegensis]RZZ89540.1 F0F1 ATP synthase subunit delta [Pseudoxanthomonas winnipegensis]TAA33019.1 F0F1 ATP synthase subunit delta [Pseudoxanthomonas winnipegensis]TBV78498.1 F0F1 ATP synthase subunit delta [Pseudoxanthomonas winnipegensis]
MSQSITLARPYARAAFGAAQDAQQLPAWSQALGFSAQVAADPRIAALLPNPQLTREQALALLAPEGAGEGFTRFLGVLADAGRLVLLPEIAALYEQLRAQAEHVVLARVTSAAELPPGELDVIKAALAKRFGRQVEVTTEVDASLIGGAIIDAGDVVIDGSLKGKLARLQTALAG